MAWALLAAANAGAQSPPTVIGPYDGQIPFRCQLQNVGTGTDFPDPGAEPFCVEFDKTNQNLTDFGLVDFTAQEPARVAAAGSKCFYFQRDHWTGSVVQGQQPELWHWDGDYWFDRARGLGGVSVRNFRLGGTPQNASSFVPEAYKPYFDEDGGGGVEVLLESNPDPTCAVKVDTPEERDRVYGAAAASRCIEPGGRVRGQRVGRAAIGMTIKRVRARLGPPSYARKSSDGWCLVGKGELRVGYTKAGRAGAILTSGRGQGFRGVTPGDKVRRAQRLLDVSDAGRLARHQLLVARGPGKRRVVLGARRDRIRWILVDNGFRGRTETFFRLISSVP